MLTQRYLLLIAGYLAEKRKIVTQKRTVVVTFSKHHNVNMVKSFQKAVEKQQHTISSWVWKEGAVFMAASAIPAELRQ